MFPLKKQVGKEYVRVLHKLFYSMHLHLLFLNGELENCSKWKSMHTYSRVPNTRVGGPFWNLLGGKKNVGGIFCLLCEK